MHIVPGLKVLYFGTPVVLISTRNEDGTANLAPMSSAWWLGRSCVLGLGNVSQTSANLLREGECVLNLPSSAMVDAVDRIALTTGKREIAPYRLEQGYRYEPDKFALSGLTAQASELVGAPRVAECPIQLECRGGRVPPLPGPRHPLQVLRGRGGSRPRRGGPGDPGTHYVDPLGWDPLIMKFCEFFGGGQNVHPSRLADGWEMPHQLEPASA